MEYRYRFGNVRLKIDSPFEIMNHGWSSIFLNDDKDTDYEIEIRIGDIKEIHDSCLIYQDRKTKVFSKEGVYVSHYRELNNDWLFQAEKHSQKMILTIKEQALKYAKDIRNIWPKIDFAGIMLDHAHLVLHASYINWNGKGIVFCGPSGIGKTTQAMLWCTKGAELINGDRVLLSIKDDLMFHSIPFAGSSGVCLNRSSKPVAIVMLGQALNNSICRLNLNEAIKVLYAQCGLKRWCIDDVNSTLNLLEQVYKKVPVYQLDCLPDQSAVSLLMNTFKKEDLI